MIRPLDWRDLALLHRMRDCGACFYAQLAFTRGPNALQHALLDVITAGRSAWTLVLRPDETDEPSAIAQCLQRADEPFARLAFLSPADALESTSGGRLIEAVARSAGERGASNLIAEVDERSTAFECLRQAGFAIYSRQRIWRFVNPSDEHIPARPRSNGDGDSRSESVPSLWRPENASDQPAINSLLLSLVPALIHQVEPPSARVGRGLVYWQEKELLGYLEVERGPLGVWVQPYFHPAAEDLEHLLRGLVSTVNGRGDRPLYVCVRSYQSWLGAGLADLWFEPFVDQGVMVKRLAVPIRQPVTLPLPALEPSRAKPTAPAAHVENSVPSHHIRSQP